MGNPLEFVGLGSFCLDFYRLKTNSHFRKSGKCGITVKQTVFGGDIVFAGGRWCENL